MSFQGFTYLFCFFYIKIKDNLKTPVYVTQSRKNAMGVGQVFVADIRTPEHSSHWILQGVALVLNVDY